MMVGRTYWIVLAIFLSFLLDSVIWPLVIPAEWQSGILLSPQLMMLVILYGAILIGRHFGFVTGFCFGLLHDVMFYGHMIGLYTAGLAFIALAAGWVSEKLKPTFYSTQLIIFTAFIVFGHYIYGIYRLFSVIDEPYPWIILHYMIPSTVMNLFFSLILYIPLRQWVEHLLAGKKDPKEP